MTTVSRNPILGSDFEIRVQLFNNLAPITDGVTFELVYFDSYNHGKVWKMPIAGTYSPGLPQGWWTLNFLASKQKFAGYYNVVCTINSNESVQKLTFRNAFYLEDSLLPPPVEPVRLQTQVEAIGGNFTGNLNIGLIVKNVEYDEDTMYIDIEFVGGFTAHINAREIFPFRVLSSADFENIPSAQLLANVFYYVYESDEVTTPEYIDLEDGTWKIILPSNCATFTPVENNEYKAVIPGSESDVFTEISSGVYSLKFSNDLL